MAINVFVRVKRFISDIIEKYRENFVSTDIVAPISNTSMQTSKTSLQISFFV